MLLSILIPLYNKEKHIERCLISLVDQNFKDGEYEIIVVDDGSSDSGTSIVQTLSKRHKQIRLFIQENQGPSVARNKAFELSSGNYVYFLDADDYVAPKILNSVVELCQIENLDIIEFNTKEIRDGLIPDEVTVDNKTKPVEVYDGLDYVAQNSFKNEAWRYLVKSELLRDTGIKFLEGTLFEDAIFTASLFLSAKRMSRVQMDVHRYMIVENSIVTSKDRTHNLKFINGMVNAIEKFQYLIGGLDVKHSSHPAVVQILKGKQKSLVVALLIRTYKYRLLSTKELKELLSRLNKLNVYPLDSKLKSKDSGSTTEGITSALIPFINNKMLLLLGLRIRNIVSFG